MPSGGVTYRFQTAAVQATGAEFPDDPNIEMQSLQRQLDSIREESIKAIEAEKTAMGRAQYLAEDGVYSRLAEVYIWMLSIL